MDKKKARFFKIFLAVIGIYFILGSWIATQILAYEVHYDPIIGEPITSFQDFLIYMPYKIWVWQYDFADFIPTLLNRAMGGLYLSSFLSFITCIFIIKNDRKSISHGSADFADKTTVEEVLPDGEGVILGWNPYKRRFIYHNGKEHVALLAPTRSGKGVGLIIPTSLVWKHSMFVTDVKGENWHFTAGYRKKFLNNKVLKFAPLASDGSSVKYNPLTEIAYRTPEEMGDTMNISNMIVDPDGKGLNDHWAKTGHALLVGVIMHLLYAHQKEERRPPTLSDVATFLSSPERDYTEQIHGMKVYPHITIKEALSDNNIFQKIYGDYITDVAAYAKDEGGRLFMQWRDKEDSWLPEWNGDKVVFSFNNLKADIKYRMEQGEEIDWKSEFTGKDKRGEMHYNYAALLTHPKAAEAAAEMENKAPNEASGVLSTTMSFLGLYRDPIVAANTSSSEFQIADLMNPNQPVSLFLVIPLKEIDRLRPLVRLVINLALRKLMPEMSFDDEPKQRCLFLLDEFPQFGRLNNMQSAMAVMAGYGLKVLMVSQDLKMLNNAYGKDHSILSNCGVRVFFTPNDLETADNISNELGSKTIKVQSHSDNGKVFSSSTSTSEIARNLMTKDEVLHLNKNKELVLVSGSDPILTKRVKYYEEDYFKRKILPEPKYSDKCTVVDKFITGQQETNLSDLSLEDELRKELEKVG